MTRLRRVVLAVLAFIRSLLRRSVPAAPAPWPRNPAAWGRGERYPGMIIGYLRDGRPIRLVAGGSTWAVLQSNSADPDPGTGAVTYTANVSAGTKLIAYICAGGGSNPEVTAVKDGSSNAMTKVGAAFLNGSAGSGELSIWAMDTPTAGIKPTITPTMTGGSQSLGIVIQEVSGLASGNTLAAMIDGTAVTKTGTISSNGSVACNAYSSSAAGEFLAVLGGDNEASVITWAAPTGSTTYTRDAHAVNASNVFNAVPFYGNSTGGAETASSALTGVSGATPWATIIVAFQSAITTLTITTTTLPAAATGVAYSQTLQAVAGTTPYTWSVSSGSLPSWASLNSSTGAITGTPSAGQSGSTFTVMVTDNVSATDTQSLTLGVQLPVTLVGSVGVASGTSSPLTAAYGQSPTAGSLLLALVSAGSTTAETAGISTSATGWSRLTSGSVGNNAAGTSKAIVDAWVKTAAGADAAPTFTQTLSGTPELTCHMYELAGADLASPLDVSAVQQTGSGTSTVTFSLTTPALNGYGEFAVSVMAQERASTTLTWTETGTGWTSSGKLPASGASVLFAQSNSQASAGPAALTDAGHWSTQSTALGAALIVTIAGAPVVGTPIALTEAGSGTDTLDPGEGAILGEAGTGADALALTAGVALAEAGTGADALLLTQPTPLAEAGAGSDQLGIAIPVPLSEAGSGSDAFAVTQPTPLAEAGSGADALGISIPTALAEAGAGADALAITQPTPLAEAGSGADTFTASIPTALAETGTGSDALVLTQPTPLADAGSGSDSLGIMPGLSEAGAGSDTLSVVSATPVALNEAGTGSDALALTQPTSLTEPGAGADALAITQPTALAEAGSGSDALGVAIPVALAEAGSGTDALTVVAAQPVALAEAGTGADQLAIDQATPLAEAGAGADSLALTQPTGLAEAGAGADQLAIAIPVALTEAGAGADALALAQPTVLTEAGAGADALSISVAGGPVVVTDTDSCSATESEFAFITSTETGSMADGAEVIVVRDTDRCAMAERELTAWPHDTDACRAAESGGPSGTVQGGTDHCAMAEHGERITLASSDACAADDEAPDIDVYTYVPPFRTGPGGGWYKVEHGSRTVVASRRVDGALLRFAAEFGRAREVRFVTDSDACGSAEASRQPVGVTVSVVPALEVSVQVSPITRGMNPGQTLLVRVTAASAGRTVTDSQVTAEFWAPGHDPERDLAYCEASCVYDERTRRWLAWVDTAGWPPGMWTVRGAVRGELSGWGWTTFPLAA